MNSPHSLLNGTVSPVTSVTQTNQGKAISRDLSPVVLQDAFSSYRKSFVSMNTLNNVNKNVVNLHIN